MKKFALSTVVAAGLVFAPNAADAFSVEADSMSEGDVNDSVNALQLELKDQGYFEGSTGSTFGPRTLSAVKAYQEDHGISSPAGNFFGVAGPQTQASLEDDNASNETAESNGSLERGAVSDAVSNLQTQLQDLGYYDGQVDSIFGTRTESAVQAYQEDHGISSPAGNFFGVAGPATMSSLEGQPSGDSGGSDNSEDNSSEGSSNAEDNSDDNASGGDNNSGGSSDDGSSDEGEVVASASNDNNSGGNESSDDDNSGSTGDVSGLIDTAMAQLGTPYEWGATGPNTFDCSGFINYVFDQNGEGFDHRADTSSLYNMGTPVSNPSEGDVVFFDTSGGVSHAGIYIGNGDFIHASVSNGVTIDSIDDPHYWGDKYLGARSF